ncbi:MAG TPA: amidohydrolase [Chloroflexia bacterium]|jgi:imidazolonepropionase-like amidohydrolase|nr:amidohydrolase [Chloroflexia bacterium]
MPTRILKGGRVLTMAGQTFDPGYIIIDNGKISATGALADLPPPAPDADVVELSGKWIVPGLIDAHTHVGIGEQGFGREGMDTNETTDPVTPQVRAIDATNPDDEAFRDALAAGVTAVNVMPGSANVVGGLAFAVKTYGSRIDQMVLRNPTGMKAAMGENPKRTHGDAKRMPSTRLGIAALFRDLCVRTQNYMAKQAQAEPGKPIERDLRLEQMALVLRREIPMRIHAHRADDILTALRIRDEFGFDMVLDHSTEAFKMPDELLRRNIPAVVGPTLTSRYKVELRERNLKTAGLLVRAGVKVALTTDHWVVPIQHLLLGLMLSVREGLDRDEALKLVTINPAEILGIADRVGSIAPGKDADLAVFSGDPLDIMQRVVRVYLDGEPVYEYTG